MYGQHREPPSVLNKCAQGNKPGLSSWGLCASDLRPSCTRGSPGAKVLSQGDLGVKGKQRPGRKGRISVITDSFHFYSNTCTVWLQKSV